MTTNEAIKAYYELSQIIKEAEAEQARLKELILETMTNEETDTMMAGNIKAMTKTVKSSRFDSKAFKADHPEQYKEYTKEGFQTRFTVNMIKAK